MGKISKRGESLEGNYLIIKTKSGFTYIGKTDMTPDKFRDTITNNKCGWQSIENYAMMRTIDLVNSDKINLEEKAVELWGELEEKSEQEFIPFHAISGICLHHEG